MLEFLRVQGLALIENMQLEFSSGINALTGETGAGKSFILKAINFLLGEKMTADMVRQGYEKAQVEAIFIHNGEELLLRRELVAETGRSRLYINDALSSQESVRELRPNLIVHTSQHGQQKLLQQSYQAALIDNFLPDKSLFEQRDAELGDLQKLCAEREDMQAKYNALAERRELLEMQQNEIDKVAPEPNEEEKLEAMRSEARQVSDQVTSFETALALLHGDDGPGLLEILGSFERQIENICLHDPKFKEDLYAVSALRELLPHMESRMRKMPQASEFDMDKLESRLYALAQLKRKLNRPLEEILKLRTEISENISFLDSCALDLKQLERKEQELTEKLKATLAKLIPMRRESAKTFSLELEQALAGLGFSNEVRVIIDFTPQVLWAGIEDEKARIFWAPNPGQTPQPLDKIASGGELSRFLLALVSIQTTNENATYIFDEVDAGIGGMTLHKVADRLQLLAKNRQMLLITHWPQLASHATKHFYVSKFENDGNTFTQCKALNENEREVELKRMTGEV